MKYLHKSVMMALIGTSIFTFPIHAGKHGVLMSFVDMASTKKASSITKKFSSAPQVPLEPQIFTRSFPLLARANTRLYHYLIDSSSQQRRPFGRRYWTCQNGPFVDPKNDVAFMKLFATEEHKPLLISFLNSLLRLQGGRAIKNVELLPTKHTPQIKVAKRAILDVKCTDQRKFQYTVIIQNRNIPKFIEKYNYTPHAYTSQLGIAVDYIELKPVILLTIANHNLFPEKIDHINYYKALDRRTREHDLEDLSYAFVELSKFKKAEADLKTVEDQWLYLFTSYNKLKSIPKEASEEIQEAYKTLEQFNWNYGARDAYFKEGMAFTDEFDALRGAIEEGRATEKKSIARTLLGKKYLESDILKITSLTPQELEQLKGEVEEKK
ncbi:MAG: Rpn family recombination-promoting nuclease/putative transposase [Alphaproteobacteria bacterium]|nr:Rpn family recombination-promoting nuclease/putative transposase [Alphaproteobacteria bacterium]